MTQIKSSEWARFSSKPNCICALSNLTNCSIHLCGLAGHIEDIAVAKSEQGKKLGIKIINTLTYIAETVGCYKTTLVCSDYNVKFYERCGFVKGQNEMVCRSPYKP